MDHIAATEPCLQAPQTHPDAHMHSHRLKKKKKVLNKPDLMRNSYEFEQVMMLLDCI